MTQDLHDGITALVETLYNHKSCPKDVTFTVNTNGRKYWRVEYRTDTQRSALGFIVVQPTKKFKVGDLLMASSWNAPATNFSRGNVIDRDFRLVQPYGIG